MEGQDMTDYEQLVKALRERARRENEWYEHGGDIINAAAAAIESLQKELDAANHQLKMYSMCPFDDEEEEE